MPLYEYYCHECGAEFEVMQRMSDPPLKQHGYHGPYLQLCEGQVERLISTCSLKFKGSGFYATDYAKASSKGVD
jgi:putative FmdB family regulatory protein